MPVRSQTYLLILLCACGAVNIIFYTLTANPVNQHSANFSDIFSDLLNKEKRNVFGHLSTLTEQELDASDRITIQNSFRKLHNAKGLDIEADRRTFGFLINNLDMCVDDKSVSDVKWDLVILVNSKINNFDRRDAIRNTWSSEISENSSLLFLIGMTQDYRLQSQIEKEVELYNDVIQVDLQDSYDNLTLKSIAMLQWLTDYCPCSKYYMKVDDDVYVNVENVLTELVSRREKKFFLCHVFINAPPIRNNNSKWYTSYEEFDAEYFPSYCSGTGYAFNSRTLFQLYYWSTKVKLIRMEDVFITGIAAAKVADVSHVHNEGFSFTKQRATGCTYQNLLTGHEVTVKQMYLIYAQITNKEIDCKTNENLYLKLANDEDEGQLING